MVTDGGISTPNLAGALEVVLETAAPVSFERAACKDEEEYGNNNSDRPDPPPA